MTDDDTQNSDTAGRSAASDTADEYVGAYDKLVRDDVPAVVRADGNRPVTRRVDGGEYERYLAAKLVEEAREYADAVETEGSGANDGSDSDESDDVLDELADVHAVLDAIVDESAFSQDDVDAREREKATDRGRFVDGVVLERIDAGE
ncbi:nucleoside triphosphate pyrophosphohydrolase [Halorubellus litoreus]|uniref:Nucleoside triphosphate pyrophosphohydrolase n=1 Tax=Halorubellus litoreus TaxID=755308 RepID=A0ABD5VF47_9EURY